jgi:hypothetical protein
MKASDQDMAEEQATPLTLGWQVLGSDKPLGRLTDVVVAPAERRVTHLVVDDPDGDARLVPAEHLVEGRTADRAVVLSCSGAELSSFPSIRSFSFVGIGDTPHGDERSDVGVEDMVVMPSFGATEFGDFAGDLGGGYGLAYDLIPTGSAELRRESTVVSADGEEVGNLDGFLVAGDRLTHIVLQRTHANETAPVAIPIESVDAIATDRITLVLPKAEVLP